jgi:hypothetical protein
LIIQYKTIVDLQVIIKEYEETLRLRPTRKFSHPTLYRKRDVGELEILYRGVREGDWFFSENKEWILPHDQMGLSFSSTYKNLKDVYRLKSKWNPGSVIDIHWVLERPDAPIGLKFVADREKNGHYFLTVTEPMLLSTLISKLKVLARQMSVIRGCK